ncbi:hypothetical protein J8244_09460 [Corynebacterium tuberculostearicum]|uniref:hypothetical protein n=1 Tax=Corynebacterium tuberculostearicum TaxID=38304 RepID=UPI002666462D|nr:hypothetical protein [Corynebacterium tuberculostearicum]WKE50348.1 hypothetical protein J8244_09460 [Corynebacterium tuberculostearicum]
MTIHIVTGPPAAGKSTYIREHRKSGDITIDYDELANTLAGLEPANHEHEAHIKSVTQKARQTAIDTAINKHDDTFNVWIIHSTPSASLITKYQESGAEIITIDPGKDVVMKRCKRERPKHMLKIAAAWYDKKTKTPKTTAERGYGTPHQKRRRQLFAQHVDGTLCPECGRPMYKDAKKNFDGAALEADHPKGSALKYAENKQATLAKRLLHRTCNRSGGAWDRPRPVPQREDSDESAGHGFVWA